MGTVDIAADIDDPPIDKVVGWEIGEKDGSIDRGLVVGSTEIGTMVEDVTVDIVGSNDISGNLPSGLKVVVVDPCNEKVITKLNSPIRASSAIEN